MTAHESISSGPTHSGRTRLAGVVGWPVSHSLSPRLHGAWLNRYGIDGAYLPLAVPPDRFDTAIRGLAASGFRGVNVTVPHKEAAAAIADDLDDAARAMGAANTLVFHVDGSIAGSNTDGFGFLENVRAGAPQWRPDRPSVVLGAGGAARAICHVLTQAGCSDIRITNRTRSRAETVAGSLDNGAKVVAWEDRGDALDGAGLLVNTTSLGMTGHDPLDIDLDRLPVDAVVTDIVYNPLQTPLLAAAAAKGCRAVDGIGMLLHQARPGFEAWFSAAPEVDDDLRAFVLAGL